jgi:hypothetical protein
MHDDVYFTIATGCHILSPEWRFDPNPNISYRDSDGTAAEVELHCRAELGRSGIVHRWIHEHETRGVMDSILNVGSGITRWTTILSVVIELWRF